MKTFPYNPKYLGNRQSQDASPRAVRVGAPAAGQPSNEIRTSKYTLLTFLPKNLLEQFRRVANFYFLLAMIATLLIDSPVSSITTVMPLVFVVSVTAIKQGYEDWIRHRSDNAVNNEKVEVVINGAVSRIRSRELRPGSLVRVRRGGDVPADVLLMCAADVSGKCYVTTANLDGETNLKTLRVPTLLQGYTPDILPQNMTVDVAAPLPDLYTFYGRLCINQSESCPVNIENLLLRGSRLKNTEWIVGCVIYTGIDTKLVQNSRFKSNKFSSSEATVNVYLIFLILVMIVAIIVSFATKRYLEIKRVAHDSYMGPSDTSYSPRSVLQDMLAFMLLYFYIIPISLYVTIEMYKFFGSLYVAWDLDLRCEATNQSAVANTSDLNEELGQIELLFSDKTGTLTKNLMTFKACSVLGHVYEERGGKLFDVGEKQTWDEPEGAFNPDLRFFFTILSTCHSVQVGDDSMKISFKASANGNLLKRFRRKKVKPENGIPTLLNHEKIIYQASSPDEKALLEASAKVNVTFIGEEGNYLQVQYRDQEIIENYERLQVLEFTSERKRMSVIVKDKDGKIWLFCKGAESSVLPLCLPSSLIDVTNNHIHQFALKGLRTLAIAYREITSDEYKIVSAGLKELRSNLDDNKTLQELSEQYRKLEENLTLIGATAVEDQLQDDVEDTLVMLRLAGIKIWVLTGDKVETAINVAQSCGHIGEGDRKLFLVNLSDKDTLRIHLSSCLEIAMSRKPEDRELTLIVDGGTLGLALGSEEQFVFADIALKCSAVLCCRLSPLQKAQIVQLMKATPGSPITAAIGDGANDISMIQEAHVGIGIFGKEGRQAARSADFAFTKFSMLRKLLLVNGHWFYQRLATLVLYFFYKNLLFVTLIFFFQIHTSFSTQSHFDSMYLTLYNTIFTAGPCFILSITEQSKSLPTLLSKPWLYRKNLRNKLMSWLHMFGWCGLAIFHATVIYAFIWGYSSHSVINMDGNTVDLWCFGSAIYHCLILVSNLKILQHARYKTYRLIISVVLTIVSFVIFNWLYTIWNISVDGDMTGTYERLLSSVAFWMVSLLICIVALLPDFCIVIFRNIYKEHFENDNFFYDTAKQVESTYL